MINFKKGLRRIILSFIGLCVIFSLFAYACNGCIWDTNRFIEQTKVYKKGNVQNQILLRDFANKYLKNDNEFVWNLDFDCHPYKQYCEFENTKFYANKTHKIIIYNLSSYTNESLLKFKNTGQYIQAEIIINMPTRFRYFSWQLLDLLTIFIIASLFYFIYLGLEFIICWIIKGFKE